VILLISVSEVARVIGVSHQHLAFPFFLSSWLDLCAFPFSQGFLRPFGGRNGVYKQNNLSPHGFERIKKCVLGRAGTEKHQ
jgi:hypothetical protein